MKDFTFCSVQRKYYLFKPGPSNPATSANPQSLIEMFDLLFANQMFEDITKYTYSKIRMFSDIRYFRKQ